MFELFRVAQWDEGQWQVTPPYSNSTPKSFSADSGATFTFASDGLYRIGATSADAAGLPIFPGLARFHEVMQKGHVGHALRMTASKTQRAYYFPPATHFASGDTNQFLPPMGLRLRLRGDYNCTAQMESAEARVLCRTLQVYGAIIADNGADWFISGAADPRWNDAHLNELKSIPASMMEAVLTEATLCRDTACTARNPASGTGAP